MTDPKHEPVAWSYHGDIGTPAHVSFDFIPDGSDDIRPLYPASTIEALTAQLDALKAKVSELGELRLANLEQAGIIHDELCLVRREVHALKEENERLKAPSPQGDVDGPFSDVAGFGASYQREGNQWVIYTMPGAKRIGSIDGCDKARLDWIVDALRAAHAQNPVFSSWVPPTGTKRAIVEELRKARGNFMINDFEIADRVVDAVRRLAAEEASDNAPSPQPNVLTQPQLPESGESVEGGEDNGHVWHERVFASMNVQCCMNCGFIKNEKQPNKPCPGPIGVSTRTTKERP